MAQCLNRLLETSRAACPSQSCMVYLPVAWVHTETTKNGCVKVPSIGNNERENISPGSRVRGTFGCVHNKVYNTLYVSKC